MTNLESCFPQDIDYLDQLTGEPQQGYTSPGGMIVALEVKDVTQGESTNNDYDGKPFMYKPD